MALKQSRSGGSGRRARWRRRRTLAIIFLRDISLGPRTRPCVNNAVRPGRVSGSLAREVVTMIVETLLYQRRWLLLGALLGVGIGLYITGEEAASGTRAPVAHAAQVATRPSRSSTIAVSEDAALVAIVNSQAGSLSVYRTADAGRVSAIETGGEPSSVVIAPDSKTRMSRTAPMAPWCGSAGSMERTRRSRRASAVGTDPVGLALAPSGRQLFVAEVANDRVSVIATATMTIEAAIASRGPGRC